MTTTTMKTLETDKLVNGPVAGPAVEQQGRGIDEAPGWRRGREGLWPAMPT